MRTVYAFTAAALLLVACDGDKAPPAQAGIPLARLGARGYILTQRAELNDLIELRQALLRRPHPDDKELQKRIEDVRRDSEAALKPPAQ